jgi:ketosteroid isomerase-like protein
MKKTITSTMLFVAFLLTFATNSVQAQTKPATPARYKDAVEENPNADADIKIVTEYVNTLVGGNADKAKMLLASNNKGHGPSAADSSTAEEVVSEWKQNYKVQSNRKFNFVEATFRVKSGNLKGNWVSLWGDYAFTQNGKNVTFPVHYIAHVTNGKIDVDRIYYDRLSVYQNLGYKLAPPAAASAK